MQMKAKPDSSETLLFEALVKLVRKPGQLKHVGAVPANVNLGGINHLTMFHETAAHPAVVMPIPWGKAGEQGEQQ